MSNIYFCSECGEDQSQFDHAFYHCHDCGECVIFDPQKVIAAHEANPEEHNFIGHNSTALPKCDVFPSPESFPSDLDLQKERYAELQCVLCCKCVDGQVLKSHPGWVRERADRDPYAFIDEINYNKELFGFIKARVDPNAKAVPKKKFYQNRQANHKLKASIIICPKPECNYRCVEHQHLEPFADIFLRHLKKVHHITPRAAFIENLKGKISYIRNNDRISYIDPFVHVQCEDLF